MYDAARAAADTDGRTFGVRAMALGVDKRLGQSPEPVSEEAKRRHRQKNLAAALGEVLKRPTPSRSGRSARRDSR